MGKHKNKGWVVMNIPGDLFEMIKEGARLEGCTPGEFAIRAIKRAIEEEKRKRENKIKLPPSFSVWRLV
ncbi:MAG: hypothetical protein QXX94_05515 [Candidatus Bathyarchaeia archaeon]